MRGIRRLLASLTLLGALACVLAPPAGASTNFIEWQAGEEDCLYAAAAAWEQYELGVEPSAGEVFSMWREAQPFGGKGVPTQLSEYWSTHPLDGIRARLTPVNPPPRGPVEEAYIVGLNVGQLPADAKWHGFHPGDHHAVLLIGRFAHYVQVASWGGVWHLTYTEWRAMDPVWYAVHRVHAR